MTSSPFAGRTSIKLNLSAASTQPTSILRCRRCRDLEGLIPASNVCFSGSTPQAHELDDKPASMRRRLAPSVRSATSKRRSSRVACTAANSTTTPTSSVNRNTDVSGSAVVLPVRSVRVVGFLWGRFWPLCCHGRALAACCPAWRTSCAASPSDCATKASDSRLKYLFSVAS